MSMAEFRTSLTNRHTLVVGECGGVALGPAQAPWNKVDHDKWIWFALVDGKFAAWGVLDFHQHGEERSKRAAYDNAVRDLRLANAVKFDKLVWQETRRVEGADA